MRDFTHHLAGGEMPAQFPRPTREYVWNGWEPVAVIEGGVVSFVRTDHIARPVFATNSTGVKVWTATYRPFGEVVTSTGNLPPPASPASGSSRRAASTRTGCATTTRRRGGICSRTPSGWWTGRVFMGM